jgi:hypothetical protein
MVAHLAAAGTVECTPDSRTNLAPSANPDRRQCATLRNTLAKRLHTFAERLHGLAERLHTFAERLHGLAERLHTFAKHPHRSATNRHIRVERSTSASAGWQA